MSFTSSTVAPHVTPETRKRKREANQEDIEVDLNAPEPPSKKALRRAKKTKPAKNTENRQSEQSSSTRVNKEEDVVPNRGKRSEYGIWIGNLSFSTTKQDLLKFMTGDTEHQISDDKVTRINLPAGQVKYGKFQNKGFAYIDLADAHALQSALQLSEKLLGGRRVLIKDATSFEGRPKEGGRTTSSNPPSKRIFIGNLDFDTTVEDLEMHFGPCGPIQYTHMATFEDSGKCKGYAWIEFEQISSGQAAMRGWIEQSNEASNEDDKRSKRRIWLGKIKGRKLRLEFAEDKTIRYNKRFGKNSVKEEAESTEPVTEEPPSTAYGNTSHTRARHENGEDMAVKQHQREARPPRKQRYTEQTVQRLTGAIVEGSGKKVVFS